MPRLRVGLVGAGLVGQSEHAFYLWQERDCFDFVGLADASPSVRASLGARYGLEQLHDRLDDLLSCNLDAVVIAAPDPLHPELAVKALDAGVHVLCEKPLALTPAGCDAIAAARDRSAHVAQVAYMKRHDPAYRRALDLLPDDIEDVRLISVEVNDPDHAPFVAHLPMTWPDDLPASLREETARRAGVQLGEAAGRALDEAGARALGGGFLSALVHDVAVVHGMLARLGCELPAHADHGTLFDEGRGVEFGFALPGSGRVRMCHLNLTGVPDYSERITVYCADRIIELLFPSPYLRHLPTRLTVRRGSSGALETLDHRESYDEAFRAQLRAFHAAACGRGEVETTVEQARGDIELLISAFRRAAA
ncbi:MAG: Gfo/Idh/MocA family oxidoreductase [Pseudomonadota bacterium]|nr:Gfo/Idh/MocA family oxidoreductase [Pseudomonadota bacterium]